MKKNNTMKRIIYLGIWVVMMAGLIPSAGYGQTVADLDGNVYQTVMIGTQCWMAENLKVTRFRNGDTIPGIADDDEWGSLETGAWCHYNDEPANAGLFGSLYNWYALTDERKLCPEGWQTPVEADWDTLFIFLETGKAAPGETKKSPSWMVPGRGVSTTGSVGGMLKATSIWLEPNRGATNESGFTALPAGYREGRSGAFTNLAESAWFWSATPVSDDKAWAYRLNWGSPAILQIKSDMRDGFSVRCVRE